MCGKMDLIGGSEPRKVISFRLNKEVDRQPLQLTPEAETSRETVTLDAVTTTDFIMISVSTEQSEMVDDEYQ